MMKSSSNVFCSSRRRHTRYWRDWSSDVCSSDLGPDEQDGDHHDVGDDLAEAAAEEEQLLLVAGGEGLGQIGRASCRERVKISVVAVSLKKKPHKLNIPFPSAITTYTAKRITTAS